MNGRKIWAFGGGRGVGKSFLSAGTARTLTRLGRSVAALDLEPGEGSLHSCLQSDPSAGEALELIQPPAIPETDPRAIGTALVESLHSRDDDFILVDLGGEIGPSALDVFDHSDMPFVLIRPDSASIQDAFLLLQRALYGRIERCCGGEEAVLHLLERWRSADSMAKSRTMTEFRSLLHAVDPRVADLVTTEVGQFRPQLVLNMARSNQDRRLAAMLQSACRKLLGVRLRFAGVVFLDSCEKRESREDGAGALSQIRRLLPVRIAERRREREAALAASAQKNQSLVRQGLNDNLELMGTRVHVQTEDLGATGGNIVTQVFLNGRVILSTTSPYPAEIETGEDPRRIRDLMREQHFNVIRQIENKKTQLVRNA